MQHRLFDHVDQRVRSLAAVRSFYDGLARAIGLPHATVGPNHIVYFRRVQRVAAEAFAVIEDSHHSPGATRIAFGAPSRVDVDRIAAMLPELGATTIEGPLPCPEYSPTYYAVFFEDPDGNKLEICHR